MGGPILVVDDSPTICRVIAAMLQKSGHEALVAPDAAHAIELAKHHGKPVVAALIDAVMPHEEGVELCKKFRADPRFKGLPLVLMSAAEGKLEGAAEVGAVPLGKPFDGAALRGALGEAIQRAKAPPHPRPTPPSSQRIPASKPTLTSRSPAIHDTPITEQPALDEKTLTDLAEALLMHLGNRGWYDRHELEQAAVSVLAQHRAGQLAEPPPQSIAGPREVLRGVADAVPLGEVMQVLQMQMQTGILEVRRGDSVEVRVYFRDGRVDLVTSRGASGEFLMGRYLLEEGLVERETLAEAVSTSQAHGRLLGDELVERGAITRDQLVETLMRQSSELIYEVLRWTGARYVFLRGGSRPRGLDAELGLPVASLVMEGFRRVDEWRMIEEHLAPDLVLMRDEVSIDRMGAKRLGRLETLLLDAIDGQKTVKQLLDEASVSSFEGSKTLYQFIQSRLVRRRSS